MRDTGLDVDDLLRTSTDVEIPPEVEARLRRRLAEFRTRVERPAPRLAFARSLLEPARFRVPAAAAVALTVIVLAVVFSGGSDSRAYAAAATRLGSARSLQYTIVIAPFVEIEFSYLAPSHQRVSCSWGVEIKSDGSGTQLVLMHYARSYVKEQGKQDSLASSANFVRQLQALPEKADTYLGEQRVDGLRLVGYRVHPPPGEGAVSGVEALDLWLDGRSGNPHHVDIVTAAAGKSRYEMHIKNIRVDSEIDPTVFEMAPPDGYVPLAAPAPRDIGRLQGPQNTAVVGFHPTITQVGSTTAVVVAMSGSYLQARAAVEAVASHLQRVGVAPSGPPFGRFDSELQWDAGYPVPAATPVAAPFQLITLPAGSVASVVVKGPWGQDSTSRWSALFTWLIEQGYAPAGPPMESWSGEDGRPDAQVTEMRIAVNRPAK